MGSTKLTRDELAMRVQTGRYEFAAKAEVKAFVDQRLELVTGAIGEEIEAAKKFAEAQRVKDGDALDRKLNAELRMLKGRLAILELSTWARFKFWAAELFEELVWAVSSTDESQPVVFDVEAARRESLPPIETEVPEDLASTPALEEAIAAMRASPPELLIVDHSDPIAAARAGVAFMATNHETLGDPEE